MLNNVRIKKCSATVTAKLNQDFLVTYSVTQPKQKIPN